MLFLLRELRLPLSYTRYNDFPTNIQENNTKTLRNKVIYDLYTAIYYSRKISEAGYILKQIQAH